MKKLLTKVIHFLYITIAMISVKIFAETPLVSAQGESLKSNWFPPDELLLKPNTSDGFIAYSPNDQDALISLLQFAQVVLLKVVLPLVAVWCGLYIAYLLFTAEWDEGKLKKAWTSLVYSVIGIISIMLAYYVVNLITRLNIS